jgi:hypothetical protein
MGAVPAWLLRHTATIEPYLGNSATGPLYGPPVTVACFVDAKRRMVRDATGTQVVSNTTIICPLSTVAPAESKVTNANGTNGTVLQSLRRDGGGLPTPDHLELSLT